MRPAPHQHACELRGRIERIESPCDAHPRSKSGARHAGKPMRRYAVPRSAAVHEVFAEDIRVRRRPDSSPGLREG